MKYAGWIVGSIAIALLALILFTDGCSKKHVESVVDNSEIIELRQHLIDSIRKISDKEKLAVIDSIRLVDKKTASRLKVKIGKLETELQSRIDSFNQDTTGMGDEFDYRMSQARSIIEDCQTVNDSLHLALRAQESLTLATARSDSIHVRWYEQEKSDHATSDDNIRKLKAEIQSQNTWWKRNGKWVCGGIGFVLGVFVMK